jgi:20S proteasome alpha/beta subunit
MGVIIVLVLSFILNAITSANFFSLLPKLSFLLRSRLRGEKQYRSTYISEYDEEGQIREMKNIEHCINQASPIVVIQVSNGTVIGYCSKPDSLLSSNTIIGVDYITYLNHPKFYLLCTGLGGDCRETISSVKQFILNTTFEKNIIPSGKLTSSFLGSMFQKATTGKTRSYACHAIICDMRNIRSSDSNNNSNSSSSSAGILYDIQPSGEVQQVYGNVIGKGSRKAYHVLEKEFNFNMSLTSATELVNKVMSICLETESISSSSSSLLSSSSSSSFTSPAAVKAAAAEGSKGLKTAAADDDNNDVASDNEEGWLLDSDSEETPRKSYSKIKIFVIPTNNDSIV